MRNPFRQKPEESSVSRITINGQTFEASGNNVVIRNGVVTVDGMKVTDGLHGVVKVIWEGPLAFLDCDSAVECGDVRGDVRGGNSVKCENVQGNVHAGNSVKCGNVGGSCTAGNSISRR